MKLLTNREPSGRWLVRDSVVECGSPLPLSPATIVAKPSETSPANHRSLHLPSPSPNESTLAPNANQNTTRKTPFAPAAVAVNIPP